MAISETARRNHAELFPNHVSTLATSDPELVEIFDNWAFDDMLGAATLTPRLRLMTQLAALIACGAVYEYRVMLGAALEVDVTPAEAKEILYQAVPYVGMGKVFDFLPATNDVLRERGITLPLPAQSTVSGPSRFEQGRAAQKRIFGEGIATMAVQAPADQAHIQRFLASNCFGDYYTRSGLDLATRELVTFAMLAALGGCEPQLTAHVAGNLRMGNGRALLVAVLTQMLPFIGYPRTLNALRVVTDNAGE